MLINKRFKVKILIEHYILLHWYSPKHLWRFSLNKGSELLSFENSTP